MFWPGIALETSGKEGFMVEIDARGQQCPIPLVRTKQALGAVTVGETVVTLVDNDVAVTNVTNLAKSLKFPVESAQRGENDYAVTIQKTEEMAENTQEAGAYTAVEPKRVVSFGSRYMGTGSDELGAILMKGFIFALTQQDVLPQSLLFYNSGAVLTCEGSESLEDLKKLEEAGVEILTCGTCLNHYEMADKLAVGQVTNMYVIVEKQMNATVIVRP